MDTSEIDTSAMDTSAMDTSAADTPAKPIPVKAEKAKTPAKAEKAEKAKTPAKAEKAEKAKTPAKAEKVEKEVSFLCFIRIQKECCCFFCARNFVRNFRWRSYGRLFLGRSNFKLKMIIFQTSGKMRVAPIFSSNFGYLIIF